MAGTSSSHRSGPLRGYKGVLLGGIGPAPYASMLLADMGADIVRIERAMAPEPGHPLFPELDVFARGQRTVDFDLKSDEGRRQAWSLIDEADFLIEGFRPGVLERLGFGPEACHARNKGLVIARITGWGQTGPLANDPGHDINYIGLTGALASMPHRGEGAGRALPLNLVGDFAGGGMWACLGILSALLERGHSGQGQVVDAAMVDGALSLMSMAYVLAASGGLSRAPGRSLLDGGAHLYDTYACADGGEVAVGAVEPQFHQALCGLLGQQMDTHDRLDPATWPARKAELAGEFLTRTRGDWCDEPEARRACVTPVLSIPEAWMHPHHQARGSFMERDGIQVPSPGPRFSRTPVGLPDGYSPIGDTT